MHSVIHSIAKENGDVAMSPVVLLVEPDLELLDDRTTLLLRSGYLVVPARGVREICEIRSVKQIDIAVLRISDGVSTLCCAAESVRRQWPTARILILGCAHNCLEDPLYDEAVESGFQPETFLRALAQLREALQNHIQTGEESSPERVATSNLELSCRKSKAIESEMPRALGCYPSNAQLRALSTSVRK